MLLAGHDAARLGGACQNGLLVEGLDAVGVDDLGGHALLGQLLGSLERLVDLDAARDDRDVGALAKHAGAAQDHLKAGLVDLRDLGAAHAHVHRALDCCRQTDGGAGALIVGGHQDAHVGQCVHERDVLEHLVAAAVGAHGKAGVGGAHLDVELAVAHGVANLVVAAAGAEDGEGAREGDAAGERKARGDADHVGLGDTDIDQASRVVGAKLLGGGGTGEVGVNGDHVKAGLGELDEGLAKSLARSAGGKCVRHTWMLLASD